MEYKKLMEKWEVKLDNPDLDPAFVQKATEFETKLKNNELSDDEIKAWDNDLVNCFNELHNFSEEESAEVLAAKRKTEIAEAKNEIAEAETLESLTGLQQKFAHLTELAPFIQKRIEKIQKVMETEQENKFSAEASAEIQGADYETLPSLLEKYKDYPQIVKSIEARIEAEKPAPAQETLRDKLQKAKKREWSYGDLKAIGIEPTGDDMEIEGVYLERQYMFKVYKIIRVDGVKV
jgi:hypothetical protein